MKNIKISDAFDTMDCNLLDKVEVKTKFIFGISENKIKRRVLNNIGIENCFINTKTIVRQKLKILIPVAVLIFAIPFGIFASSNSIAVRTFFEDSINFLQGKTQDINLVANSSGITMNLETAVNDDKSGTLLFNFTNNDGSKFDNGITLGEVEIEGLNGYSINSCEKFSDDMEVLSCYTNISTNSNLPNKKLTLTVKSLIKQKTDEKSVFMDLQKLYDSNPISVITSNNDIIVAGTQIEVNDGTLTNMQNFNIPIIPKITSSFKIEGIAFINDSLRILTSSNNDDSIDVIKYLIDSKTGEKTQCEFKTNANGGNDGKTFYSLYTFNISKPKDLRNSQLFVAHTTKNVINGNWGIEFKLDRTESPIRKDLNIVLNDNNNKIHITNITVSMKGIFVEGFLKNGKGEMFMNDLNTIPNIELNDGNILGTSWKGTEFDQKTKYFILSYEPDMFVNINRLISISIQRIVIPIK